MKSNMNFNATKCKVLSVTRSRSPLLANYHIGPDEVLRVSSEVDLGIILTSNLTWNSHIDKIVAKANKMLGLLRRTCPLLTNCDGRRTLYLSLVKSKLSYASAVWSPYHSNNKVKLEKIQRRATRWILNLKKGDTMYKERLLTLNLVPLAYAREIKDLTFFYKLVNGFYDLDILNYVSFVSHGRTRNCGIPSLILNTPSCRTNTFQSSFFNRIVPLRNRVCKGVICVNE